MPSYTDIKDELAEIATLVEKFPESLKPEVFKLLLHEYFGGDLPKLVEGGFKSKPEQDFGENSSDIESHRLQESQVGGNGEMTFDEFARSCENISSAYEKNLVIIYYYEMIIKKAPVEDNVINEEYKKMGWKPNKAFRQSLNDTKTKRSWIYREEGENSGWLTTHQGAEYVNDKLMVK